MAGEDRVTHDRDLPSRDRGGISGLWRLSLELVAVVSPRGGCVTPNNATASIATRFLHDHATTDGNPGTAPGWLRWPTIGRPRSRRLTLIRWPLPAVLPVHGLVRHDRQRGWRTDNQNELSLCVYRKDTICYGDAYLVPHDHRQREVERCHSANIGRSSTAPYHRRTLLARPATRCVRGFAINRMILMRLIEGIPLSDPASCSCAAPRTRQMEHRPSDGGYARAGTGETGSPR
jgi:hypothetical protein